MSDAPPTAALTPALSVDKPEDWLDRPLLKDTVPTQWRGKSYRQLALVKEGRMYLREKLEEGDPFAAKTLQIYAHALSCTCDVCKKLLANPPFVKKGADAPLVPIEPLKTKEMQKAEAKAVEAGEKAVAEKQAAADNRGAAPYVPVKVRKKRTAAATEDAAGNPIVKGRKEASAEEIAAEGDIDGAAKAAADKRVRGLVESIENVADDVLLKEHETRMDALVASELARQARDRRLHEVDAELGIIQDPYTASTLARLIKEADDDLAALEREWKAILRRAERRVEIASVLLLPKLEDWANRVPVDARPTEKSVRVPAFAGRLTFVWRDEHFEITDKYDAQKAIEKTLGTDEAIEAGVIVVKEEISESGLKRYLESTMKPIDGTKFVPGKNKLVIYRETKRS